MYLTVEEVAERFRTTPATVRFWRNTGVGPKGTRFGRRVLYTPADVEAWEAQLRQAEEEHRAAVAERQEAVG